MTRAFLKGWIPVREIVMALAIVFIALLVGSLRLDLYSLGVALTVWFVVIVPCIISFRFADLHIAHSRYGIAWLAPILNAGLTVAHFAVVLVVVVICSSFHVSLAYKSFLFVCIYAGSLLWLPVTTGLVLLYAASQYLHRLRDRAS